ncbi:MAG: RimK family alpha-L-glutamate ligase [Acidobacteria bacterium]|nr:RimK family alpha-L-glutamate ligase [Acidobacteriota bacterium]
MTRIAILSSGTGYHLTRLIEAFAAQGAEARPLPIPRLIGSTSSGPILSSKGESLVDFDAVVVRVIPLGSLEQIIFRMDALHLLERLGVPIFNPPRAIERTVDKFWTSSLLEEEGLPTPRTVAAESFQDAMEAFAKLGGNVVVKPLFGSGGRGIFRLNDEEMAYRAFRTMEMHRWIYYLQEFIPRGLHDVRAFVIGERIVACCKRSAFDWRRNVARGAMVRPFQLSEAQQELVLHTCSALQVEYAGVDLIEDAEGKTWILEANSIPGWVGLQESTSIDIAAEIAGHVLARARGSRRTLAAG